jgi:Txe/YoeB family toxin of Txe-Axe toxin-antitoxin module
MIVANVTTGGTDNPMYEDENGNAVFEKDLVEQKTPWSKEDERTIKRIDSLLHAINESEFEDIHNWLKSLRPQNSSVTDEELEQAKKDAYNDALDKIEYHSGEPTFDDGWDAAIWYLKKRNTMSKVCNTNPYW